MKTKDQQGSASPIRDGFQQLSYDPTRGTHYLINSGTQVKTNSIGQLHNMWNQGTTGFHNFNQREARAKQLQKGQVSCAPTIPNKPVRHDAEVLPNILESMHLGHHLPPYKMQTCSPDNFQGMAAKNKQVSNAAFLRKRKNQLHANQPKFSPERIQPDNFMKLPANLRHMGIYQTSVKVGLNEGRTSPMLSGKSSPLGHGKNSPQKPLKTSRSPSISKLNYQQSFGELKPQIEKVTPKQIEKLDDATLKKTLLQSQAKALSVHQAINLYLENKKGPFNTRSHSTAPNVDFSKVNDSQMINTVKARKSSWVASTKTSKKFIHQANKQSHQSQMMNNNVSFTSTSMLNRTGMNPSSTLDHSIAGMTKQTNFNTTVVDNGGWGRQDSLGSQQGSSVRGSQSPSKFTQQASFSDIKRNKQNLQQLNKYTSIKKENVRNKTVRGFLNQSQSRTYANKILFKNEKRENDSSSDSDEDTSQKRPSFSKLGLENRSVDSRGSMDAGVSNIRFPNNQSPQNNFGTQRSSLWNGTSSMTDELNITKESKFSNKNNIRKGSINLVRDNSISRQSGGRNSIHQMALTQYTTNEDIKQRKRLADLAQDSEHDFPFVHQMIMGQISTNKQPVQMNLRNRQDFDGDALALEKEKEATNFAQKNEIYKAGRELRRKTKGNYGLDEDRIKIVKHNGQHWTENQKALHKVNEGFAKVAAHRTAVDNKKLEVIRKTRILGGLETIKNIERNERDQLKKWRKDNRQSWQREPRSIDNMIQISNIQKQ